jgi:DNA polymerase I
MASLDKSLGDSFSTELLFYPVDVTYKVVDGKARIYMYGRDSDGAHVCVVDPDFEPYFYVVLKKPDKEVIDAVAALSVAKKDKKGAVTRVVKEKKFYKTGDVDALKVFVDVPSSVPLLREAAAKISGVSDVLEADILFTRRYLMDKKIVPLTLTRATVVKSDERSRVPVFMASKVWQESSECLSDLKVFAFDIETYNPEGRVISQDRFPIVMLSLYGKDFKKVLTWKKFNTDFAYVEFLDSEKAMLERFRDILIEEMPDVLTGYYSSGFDFPYIFTRAMKNKVKLDFCWDYSEAYYHKRQGDVRTVGMVHLDILSFIRRVVSKNMATDSLKLDNVALELLGEHKAIVDLSTLATAWDSVDPVLLSGFCEYNLIDSKLTYDLFVKLTPNMVEFVKLLGQPLSDVTDMSFSQFVEWYLMRKASEFNSLIPNKPSYHETSVRMHSRVKGAFVFEPKPGLYHSVAVFDFRSLYPSIITSHNISPETLNVPCAKDKRYTVPLEGCSDFFCLDKPGFFSTVLGDVISRRVEVKKLMKKATGKDKVVLDAAQYSLKILANSFYGYLGFSAARWYSKECAAATTAFGRYYIHKVIDAATAAGFTVLYSDTDSIFLWLDKKSAKDASLFQESINKDMPGNMELDFEGVFKAALFVSVKGEGGGAKKKYAMVDDKGHLKIKGFETVRRNSAVIAKETQEAVIKLILIENDHVKALDYVKDVINSMRAHSVPVEKVVINTQISKSTESYDSISPHVAVAKRMNAAGNKVSPGDVIQWVVTVGKGKIGDRARLPIEITQADYDADYYIYNQIIPSVENILAVFGYTAEDLEPNSPLNLKKKQQKGLGEWV